MPIIAVDAVKRALPIKLVLMESANVPKAPCFVGKNACKSLLLPRIVALVNNHVEPENAAKMADVRSLARSLRLRFVLVGVSIRAPMPNIAAHAAISVRAGGFVSAAFVSVGLLSPTATGAVSICKPVANTAANAALLAPKAMSAQPDVA